MLREIIPQFPLSFACKAIRRRVQVMGRRENQPQSRMLSRKNVDCDGNTMRDIHLSRGQACKPVGNRYDRFKDRQDQRQNIEKAFLLSHWQTSSFLQDSRHPRFRRFAALCPLAVWLQYSTINGHQNLSERRDSPWRKPPSRSPRNGKRTSGSSCSCPRTPTAA
nr:MAG TPA: hypothetical protein [Caudoviricetes sp.]